MHTSLDDDLRLVDLNCRSTVHLAKLVVRDMVAAGEGRLLFTSSIAAAAPSPYQATYGASKAFVHSFAEALRHELRGTGVTVTSLVGISAVDEDARVPSMRCSTDARSWSPAR